MKNKLWMGVIGLALSATMIVTASVSALAANCGLCKSANVSRIYHEKVSGDYINPDLHMITYWDYYDCQVEGCVGAYEEYSYEYEAHDYELNVTTNQLECLGCGDTY